MSQWAVKWFLSCKDSLLDDPIRQAARDIAAARYAAALTGAGISVDSGIPPFRGKGGLWEKIDPMEFAHIDALKRDPEKVWKVLIEGMNNVVNEAKPNDAHTGLAKLEALGKLKTVITQNIDGLHQRAGSADVIEFHGNFARQRCMDCSSRFKTRDLQLREIPPRCDCGGILRPEVVFFGELIPPHHLSRSHRVAAECDLMLVVGTSAVVEPAASIPILAKETGAKVIEINPEKTSLSSWISDTIVRQNASDALKAIVSEVERLL